MGEWKRQTQKAVERLRADVSNLESNYYDWRQTHSEKLATLAYTLTQQRRQLKASNHQLRLRIKDLENTVLVLQEATATNFERTQVLIDAMAEKIGYEVELVQPTDAHVELKKIEAPKKLTRRR